MNGSLPGSLKEALNKVNTDKDYGELIRTSFFALLVRVSGIITGFLVTLLTTRYYGADALGIVSICLAILSFASVFGKMGFDVALMKYIAGFATQKNYGGMRSVYLKAIKIILPATIFISAFLYFLAPWMSEKLFHKPYLTSLLSLNAWLALPLVLLLFNSECVRGLKRIKTYTFLQTVSVSLFASVVLILLSFRSTDKFIPAYVQFICISISGLLSLGLWFRYSKFFHAKSISQITSKDLVRTASPMFVTTLMQLIMSWAGTLILASFVSEKDIGIYNALIRISVVTNITILAINSLSMPRFAESFASKSFEQLRKHAGEASRLIFLTSLPIFFVLAFFPQWILSIFGKEFPGNENALYVLLAGQFIVCFSGLPSQILNMAGRQHALRNISIISAIVNVVACLILIPRLGIMGACIAQLIGTFTWNVLSLWSVKRYFGFFVFFKFR